MSYLIPSDRWPDALAALEEVGHDARSLSIAVAFVTDTGAELLIQFLENMEQIDDVEVVARAGGVTAPSALRTLRDRLGARVSVAIGRDSMRFHPKLWLIRGDAELTVLSGSGNLTQGGMRDNFEQFELTRMPLDTEEATAQEERFLELTASAYSLDSIEDTVAWSLWEQMITKSKTMRAELRRLEEELSNVAVKLRPGEESKALLSDLYAIYHATVQENIITPKGKPYRPTRFLVGINRARDGGDPVELVSSLCRRQTGGFDIILQHGDPLLTVESLVVDQGRSYHHLFSTKTKERAAERLRQFSSRQT